MTATLPLSLHDHDELYALAQMDGGYRSALHILRSPRFARDRRIWNHVVPHHPNRGIYFERMIATGGFSHGEELLLHTAWSLFNGGVTLSLDDLSCTLDATGLQLAVEAIALRALR